MRVSITRQGFDMTVEVPDEALPRVLRACGLLPSAKAKKAKAGEITYKCVGVTGKISAIKIVRILLDLSLLDAKNLVESICPGNPWIYDPLEIKPRPCSVQHTIDDQDFLRDAWPVLVWEGPVPPCPRLPPPASS